MARKVIVHYHVFKNAGTSIDHILKTNFTGFRWHNEEFPTTPDHESILSDRSNSRLVQKWIANHPEVVVLSSHTAVMPLPKLPETEIFPIIMVRNPIVRLQSSYLFQRQRFESGFEDRATRLAGQNDLAGYLRGLLKQGRATNFTSVRLAAAVPGSVKQIRQRAFRALQVLPFVGVTEMFEQSMKRMELWLAPHFPAFRVLPTWQNASDQAEKPVSERLAEIRREIGAGLYAEILEANRLDIEVHEAASRMIGGALRPGLHQYPDGAQPTRPQG
ncbi:MAG: sulfotransferase family 2 domain-containing protein [Gammaproteobacteria bacterium]|nr:sulfotransferase family 2 domain-containing protein [Gammaproteobacteria bacterium]